MDMARRKEKSENRPVLCPIALDESWKSKVDVSHGPGDENRQLWRTMVSKNVMDFSAWRTEAFQEVFDKLVRGLRLYYGPKNSPPGT